tara:strand:- start:67 stop:1056 length:990 start_codon:yes stop_codon:yes gene_type:complete
MLKEEIIKGELDWIKKVATHPLNVDILKDYYDWLKSHNESRAIYLKQLINVLNRKFLSNLKNKVKAPKEWLDIIGYSLIKELKNDNGMKHVNILRPLLRPAFKLETNDKLDDKIPIGKSKIGGLPDLPDSLNWPTGEECKINWNYSTDGENQLAGFIAQINFSDFKGVADIFNIPSSGILSIFCFQDGENGDPENIGVGAYYFKDTDTLKRVAPPLLLSEGNKTMPSEKLNFEMMLDLPETYDGPWTDDYGFDTNEHKSFFDSLRDSNFYNFLGYARSTTGGDPTKSKDDQHLFILETCYDCRIHLQINKENLKENQFEKIILSWVDFN